MKEMGGERKRKKRKGQKFEGKQGREKKKLITLYVPLYFIISVQNQKEQQQQREITKAKLTAVAVKPNFLKKDFKDLTLPPQGAEGRGKTFTVYKLLRAF